MRTPIVLITSLLSFCLAGAQADEIGEFASDHQKSVLVTGASSGIGRQITEMLAENDHFVYAGARKQADLDSLNQLDNVQAIRLDVTIQEQIDEAVETVRHGGRGLYGIVNNAGVSSMGPLIEVDEDEVEWVFDINVFGVFRVTRAFAPLIIESKGRIVNISSLLGTITRPLGGVYSMSKHAIEAYSDALAMEMERFDVMVSVVAPGNYRSRIKYSEFRRVVDSGLLEGSLYAEDMKREMDEPMDRNQFMEPVPVAEATLHALFAEQPKPRYMVASAQREADWTIRKIISELVQYNAQHSYSFSRDELVDMLDQAIDTD